MTYDCIIVVTQTWRLRGISADTPLELINEIKLAYNRCSNPWEELEPIGEENVAVLSVKEET